MSEQKKVIHVKDLVIKADNVIIDRGPGHRRDPFFGFQRREEAVEEREERMESSHERESDDRREDDEDRRRPFSWI